MEEPRLPAPAEDEVLESPLCELTEPLALLILSLLPPRDRVRCSALSSHYRALVASPVLWQHLRVERGWSAQELEGMLTYSRASLRTVDVQTTRVGDLKLLLRLLRPAAQLETLAFAFPARLVAIASTDDFWPLAALLRGVAGDAERAGRVVVALGALFSAEEDLDELAEVGLRELAKGIVLVREILSVLGRHREDRACVRDCLEVLSSSSHLQNQALVLLSQEAVETNLKLVCDVLETHRESRRVQFSGLSLLAHLFMPALHSAHPESLMEAHERARLHLFLTNPEEAAQAASPASRRLRPLSLLLNTPPAYEAVFELGNIVKLLQRLLAVDALLCRCADSALAALRRHLHADRSSLWALDDADGPAFNLPEPEEEVDDDFAGGDAAAENGDGEPGAVAEEEAEIEGELQAEAEAPGSTPVFVGGSTCGRALSVLTVYLTDKSSFFLRLDQDFDLMRHQLLTGARLVKGAFLPPDDAEAASSLASIVAAAAELQLPASFLTAMVTTRLRRLERFTAILALLRPTVEAHPASAVVQNGAAMLVDRFLLRVNAGSYPLSEFVAASGAGEEDPTWHLSGLWALFRAQLRGSVASDYAHIEVCLRTACTVLEDPSVGPERAEALLSEVWQAMWDGIMARYPDMSDTQAGMCVAKLLKLAWSLLEWCFLAAAEHPPHAAAAAAIAAELPDNHNAFLLAACDSEEAQRLVRVHVGIARFARLCARCPAQPPLVFSLLRLSLGAASLAALGFPPGFTEEAGDGKLRRLRASMVGRLTLFPFVVARHAPDFGAATGLPSALVRLASIPSPGTQKRVVELLGYSDADLSDEQRSASHAAAVVAAGEGAVQVLSDLIWEHLSDLTDKDRHPADSYSTTAPEKLGLAALASLDSLALALRPLMPRTAATAELIARAARAYTFPGDSLLRRAEHAVALVADVAEMGARLKALQAQEEEGWDGGALDAAADWLGGLEERAAEMRTEAAAALKVLETLSPPTGLE